MDLIEFLDMGSGIPPSKIRISEIRGSLYLFVLFGAETGFCIVSILTTRCLGYPDIIWINVFYFVFTNGNFINGDVRLFHFPTKVTGVHRAATGARGNLANRDKPPSVSVKEIRFGQIDDHRLVADSTVNAVYCSLPHRLKQPFAEGFV